MNPQALQSLAQIKASNFDPDEIRRTVERAKSSGLIRPPGTAIPLKITGAAAAAFDQVKVQFLAVTPDLARQWLRNNLGNRKLKPDTVAAYARDMRNREWLTNHQGLAFDEKDQLIDGQHRLQAIVDANVTITLMVSTGWPISPKSKKTKTMDTVDRGVARTVADVLHLQHGIQDSGNIVKLAAALAQICIGEQSLRGCHKNTTATTLAIMEIFAEPIKWLLPHLATAKGLRHASVSAAIALGYAVAPKKTAAFYDQLKTGVGLSADSPALHLRTWLMSDSLQRQRNGSYSGRTKVWYATLSCLHAYLENRGVHELITTKFGREKILGMQPVQVGQVRALFIQPK